MMLKGILSISGQSGLFRLIAESKNRIIVESLISGKRMPVAATVRVSSLEDIAVYTNEGDLPLKDVFKMISEGDTSGLITDAKSSDQDLRNFFEKVVPGYDRDRVYISDIRKIVLWYNLLNERGMLDFSEEEGNKEDEVVNNESVDSAGEDQLKVDDTE